MRAPFSYGACEDVRFAYEAFMEGSGTMRCVIAIVYRAKIDVRRDKHSRCRQAQAKITDLENRCDSKTGARTIAQHQYVFQLIALSRNCLDYSDNLVRDFVKSREGRQRVIHRNYAQRGIISQQCGPAKSKSRAIQHETSVVHIDCDFLFLVPIARPHIEDGHAAN